LDYIHAKLASFASALCELTKSVGTILAIVPISTSSQSFPLTFLSNPLSYHCPIVGPVPYLLSQSIDSLQSQNAIWRANLITIFSTRQL